jgi:2,2-dialkylglycine decarboxylase (pyruvate)
MSSLLGHAHPEIVAVVEQNVKKLDHVFSGMVTQPVVDLCDKLTALLPCGLD